MVIIIIIIGDGPPERAQILQQAPQFSLHTKICPSSFQSDPLNPEIQTPMLVNTNFTSFCQLRIVVLKGYCWSHLFLLSGGGSNFINLYVKDHGNKDHRQHCRLTICRLVEFVKSETNPNNNMMMRRAGLSKGSWYLKDIDGFTFSYCPEVIYPIHCIVYRESYKFITSYATVRVPEIYTCRKPRISDLMRCNNMYYKMKQNCYGEDPTK